MHVIDIDTLYENLPSAFSITNQDQQLIKGSGSSPTYGELTKAGLERILSNINSKFSSLIDLGSGAGKICLNSCLYENIDRIVGVELSEQRHKIATSAQELLLKQSSIASKVQFVQCDMLEYNLNNFDICIVSNLCFNDKFNQALSEKFDKELSPGTCVFSSKHIPSSKANLITIIDNVSMSWNSKSKMFQYVWY